MNQKICVTGIGIISAIGDNVEQTLDSVRTGKSGIGALNHIATRHKNDIPIGEVKHTNQELMQILGLPTDTIITRTTLLGMMAAKEAFVWAGIKDVKEFRTGIISATSVGGMSVTEINYKDYLNP